MTFLNEKCSEIIILDEWVEVTWAGKNIPYYQKLGYVYTGKHDVFWCHIEDLSPGSNALVSVMCPECSHERVVRYNNLTKAGHSACALCSGARKDIIDLSGQRFGRLTVMQLSGTKSGTSAYWICECECGNICCVSSQSLTRGRTSSCGCYKIEQLSGENSHLWNPTLTDEDRIEGRNYPEYQKLIEEVMRRDDWTCQCCGARGTKLEVHHLYSYTAYPEYQLDADSCITLCHPHHRAFHKWMGGTRVVCTPDDYYEWLREM